jgi:hypothetical protein
MTLGLSSGFLMGSLALVLAYLAGYSRRR